MTWHFFFLKKQVMTGAIHIFFSDFIQHWGWMVHMCDNTQTPVLWDPSYGYIVFYSASSSFWPEVSWRLGEEMFWFSFFFERFWFNPHFEFLLLKCPLLWLCDHYYGLLKGFVLAHFCLTTRLLLSKYGSSSLSSNSWEACYFNSMEKPCSSRNHGTFIHIIVLFYPEQASDWRRSLGRSWRRVKRWSAQSHTGLGPFPSSFWMLDLNLPTLREYHTLLISPSNQISFREHRFIWQILQIGMLSAGKIYAFSHSPRLHKDYKICPDSCSRDPEAIRLRWL